ncbi:MAG: NADH:ubiquinone reductase (Na(+)-transporting) subunit D [Spirochaetia bacterium]|jgi:Na+-transporting NADH:ubiquinone oxidoreductase subunit D|nr:NADH:ubiquinone reductase (Na(+)-transporting) subunit D [Spirochaetia bacterium]
MSNNLAAGQKIKIRDIFADGVYRFNPITVQVLGICSALAVTNRVDNAVVMGGALIFVTAFSSLLVSILRKSIPLRIRMIVEVAIIATFVILFDQFLKAYAWNMSKQLGPYVGLIITNCIVMGRAEAFATQNTPLTSMFDGIANGIGYSIVLILVALVREIIGSGTLNIFGTQILTLLDIGYTKNLLFVLAPGAFFTAGFIIWGVNAITNTKEDANE